MGLFLQMVLLILAAALGFVVGWLLRGTRLEEDRAAPGGQRRSSGGLA